MMLASQSATRPSAVVEVVVVPFDTRASACGAHLVSTAIAAQAALASAVQASLALPRCPSIARAAGYAYDVRRADRHTQLRPDVVKYPARSTSAYVRGNSDHP
jgi:hypothetical protein